MYQQPWFKLFKLAVALVWKLKLKKFIFLAQVQRMAKQIIKKGNKNKNLTIKYWRRLDDC